MPTLTYPYNQRVDEVDTAASHSSSARAGLAPARSLTRRRGGFVLLRHTSGGEPISWRPAM
jgi:hypothetical protein